jgi:hypothetical protein
MNDYTILSLPELNDRIAILRDNIRQLTEQAAGSSGSANEERTAERIAQQQEELDGLIKRAGSGEEIAGSSLGTRAFDRDQYASRDDPLQCSNVGRKPMSISGKTIRWCGRSSLPTSPKRWGRGCAISGPCRAWPCVRRAYAAGGI